MKNKNELFTNFVRKNPKWDIIIDDIIIYNDKLFLILNKNVLFNQSQFLDEIKRYSVGFGIDKIFISKEYNETNYDCLNYSGNTFTNIIY